MPEDHSGNYLFDRPGRYLIRVAGLIDECWLEHLAGLEISVASWNGYHPVTQIRGLLADQTALSGLLDFLNDLGKVILTVERYELDAENI